MGHGDRVSRGGGGGEIGLGGGGGQGRCEQRSEVFVKFVFENSKKKIGGFGSGEGGRVGGRVGGVRVDLNEEFKYCGRLKKWWVRGRVWGGQGGCERRIEVFGKIHKKNRLGVGGQVGWGVRVNVNAMLGVRDDVGNGGCEPRIEGIVQCTKRYCTILRKLKKNVWGGREEGQYLNPKHSLCI